MLNKFITRIFSLAVISVAFGSACAGAVGKGQEPSLQKIVDTAKEGQTVTVSAGTYSLTKPLTLYNKRRITLVFAKGAEVVCLDPDEFVVDVRDSENIVIRGGVFRHAKKPKDQCSGHVLEITNCKGITIDGSDINGCGAIGLMISDCADVLVANAWVHDNWSQAFCLYDSKRVKFLACRFENNGSFFLMRNNEGVVFKDNITKQQSVDFEINNMKPVH